VKADAEQKVEEVKDAASEKVDKAEEAIKTEPQQKVDEVPPNSEVQTSPVGAADAASTPADPNAPASNN